MNSQDPIPGADAGALVTLLRRQLVLYRDLHVLASRQRVLVGLDDPGPLLALLGERQRIVAALGDLSRRLAPFQAQYRTQAADVPEEIRREAEELLRASAEMLRRILKLDDEDSRTLAARKAHTAVQIQSLTAGQQAFRAYGPAVAGAATASRTDQSA